MDEGISLRSIRNKWARLQSICWLEDPTGLGTNPQIHPRGELTPQDRTFLEEVIPIFLNNEIARNFMSEKLRGNDRRQIPPLIQSTVPLPRMELPEVNVFLPPLPLLPVRSEKEVELQELHVALMEGFALSDGVKKPVPVEDVKRVNHWLARRQYQIQNNLEHPENAAGMMFLEFFKYIADLHETTALKLRKNGKPAWLLLHMNPNALLKYAPTASDLPIYGMTELEFAEIPRASLRSVSKGRRHRSTFTPRPFG